MPTLAPFALHRATSVPHAAALLARLPGARIVAGGTDLVPNLRRGIDAPAALVDVSSIADFASIARDGDGWRIGAGATLAALAGDAVLARELPALAQAAASVAGPGHRTVATLGGNLCLDTRCVFYNQSEWWRRANAYCLKRGGSICHVAPQGSRCHAAFSGDAAPTLLVYGAQIEVVGAHGTRRLPLAELYADDGARHLTLAADELIASIRIPPQPAGARSGYRKARVRGAMDFPLAGVAIRATFAGAELVDLQVALTGTNSHPLPLADTAALCGAPVDDALLARLAKRIGKQVSPMRTTVTSSHYRRQVAIVLAQRLLRELAA
ncbi:MAG: xanthine dehydrogenase family protein subunit M [Burkholderiaceae bacterium]